MPSKKQDLQIQGQSRIKSSLNNLQGGKYPTATPEEAAERKAALKTQGKKGAKCDRYNVAFTPANYDYINIVARVKGMTMTKFINQMIDEYRENHPEIYEKALQLIEECDS